MFLMSPIKKINKKIKREKSFTKLYEELSNSIRSPILRKIKRIGRFFPRENGLVQMEVEDLSIRDLVYLKKEKEKIENLTQKISEEMNKEASGKGAIAIQLKEKLLGEWMLARQILKELREIEKEIEKKLK